MNSHELKDMARDFAGSLPDTFWGRCQTALLNHLRTEDPDNFLTWPEISGTMFVADAPYTRLELFALETSEDWLQWREVIQESDTGKPLRLPYADYTSGNLVHQAYHLKRWQDATGLKVSLLKTIIEIGGGYGAMAVIAQRMGFTGRYVIIDLPVLSMLQRFYLSQVGYTAEWALTGDGLTADLLIGLWSLSEMNEEDRGRALTNLSAAGYLVAGCCELGIASIEMAAKRETIDHLVPNSYWLK